MSTAGDSGPELPVSAPINMEEIMRTLLVGSALLIGALAMPVDDTAARSKSAKPQASSEQPSKSESGASGAATGEQGAGTAVAAGSESQLQAFDETYQSDIAQEKKLKAGGSN